MNRFTLQVLVACLILTSATQSIAQWTSPGKVTYVHSWPDFFTFAINGVNPNCASPGNQFAVPWSNPVSKQLYAMVLTAFSTGQSLAANFQCVSGTAQTVDIDAR